MTTVQRREAANLLGALGPVVDEFVRAAARSKGDFHCVEEAGSAAIQKVRTLIMSTGLAVSSQCAERDFSCPDCAVLCTSGRGVSAASRPVRAKPATRRCVTAAPSARRFVVPLEQANGLANSQFTTMAQVLVGSQAAQMPLLAPPRHWLNAGFAKELKDGRLQCFSINMEDTGNEHFMKDYKLSTPAVVVSDTSEGRETRWKALGKVWQVLEDEGAFRRYIAEEVRAYLAKPQGPGAPHNRGRGQGANRSAGPSRDPQRDSADSRRLGR